MNARGRSCTAAFSPHGFFVQVPPGRVQAELRDCFARWGRPESVQFDNGNPWGSCGDLPTPLASWLIGAGLDVSWIPARTPQENGVVERGQGVAKNWAEPDRCGSPEELQARLEEEDRVQRESLPACRVRLADGGVPGADPFGAAVRRGVGASELVVGGGAGAPGGRGVTRRVDRSGKIGLYHEKMYVGTVNRGRRCWCSSTRGRPSG